jgi:hypothetical protein
MNRGRLRAVFLCTLFVRAAFHKDTILDVHFNPASTNLAPAGMKQYVRVRRKYGDGMTSCFTAFFLKASKEELWLPKEFGEAFQTHARHSGMFLPKFS